MAQRKDWRRRLDVAKPQGQFEDVRVRELTKGKFVCESLPHRDQVLVRIRLM